MKIQTKITILGMFSGMVIVAMSSSGIACYKLHTTECIETNAPCTVKPPYCPTGGYKKGTASHPGTWKYNKSTTENGYRDFIADSYCTYTCTATEKDCANQFYVEVVINVDRKNMKRLSNSPSCP